MWNIKFLLFLFMMITLIAYKLSSNWHHCYVYALNFKSIIFVSNLRLDIYDISFRYATIWKLKVSMQISNIKRGNDTILQNINYIETSLLWIADPRIRHGKSVRVYRRPLRHVVVTKSIGCSRIPICNIIDRNIKTSWIFHPSLKIEPSLEICSTNATVHSRNHRHHYINRHSLHPCTSDILILLRGLYTYCCCLPANFQIYNS